MKLSPNQIEEELERVRRGNYHQYIKKITLNHVRGIRDEVIEFRSPVTALIGANGGGKSTILGSAAMAYKDMRPAQFFPKAFRGDETMAEWAMEYELIDRPKNADRATTRTARFAQSKWRRNEFPERHVEYIEIQRTVPAGELTNYRRFMGVSADLAVVSELPDDTITYSSAVLDKDVSNYRVVSFEGDASNKLYICVSPLASYSQFHFGAGEASVIATIDRIENAPNNSLILIEEVENGLHPVAVRLFVQYLQSVARRKRHQIIFTTHSQDAVDELPPAAIWAIINRRLFNGQLNVESLRAITGRTPDSRAVFVEDEFVVEWLISAIGWHRPALKSDTKVIKAGGYPNLLTVCQYHNSNEMIPIPALALVDGDIYKPDGPPLPEFARYIGEGIPEAVVFDYIYENRVELISLIRQRCLLAGFAEPEILQQIESVKNSACDAHIVFSALSERLGFHSALQIRSGMIDLYNERNEEFWVEVMDAIEGMGV